MRIDAEGLNQKTQQPKSLKTGLFWETHWALNQPLFTIPKGAWLSLQKPYLPYSSSTLGTQFGGACPLFLNSLPDKCIFLSRFYCQEVRAVGICKISPFLDITHESQNGLWRKWKKGIKKRQTMLSQSVGGPQSKHRVLSPDLEYYWNIISGGWQISPSKNLQHPLSATLVSTAKVNQHANASILLKTKEVFGLLLVVWGKDQQQCMLFYVLLSVGHSLLLDASTQAL